MLTYSTKHTYTTTQFAQDLVHTQIFFTQNIVYTRQTPTQFAQTTVTQCTIVWPKPCANTHCLVSILTNMLRLGSDGYSHEISTLIFVFCCESSCNGISLNVAMFILSCGHFRNGYCHVFDSIMVNIQQSEKANKIAKCKTDKFSQSVKKLSFMNFWNLQTEIKHCLVTHWDALRLLSLFYITTSPLSHTSPVDAID